MYVNLARNACLKTNCVKSKKAEKRSITRKDKDPVREVIRAKAQSDEGKEIYKYRKAIAEPS